LLFFFLNLFNLFQLPVLALHFQQAILRIQYHHKIRNIPLFKKEGNCDFSSTKEYFYIKKPIPSYKIPSIKGIYLKNYDPITQK